MFLLIFAIFSLAGAKPNQAIWMPELRGIPIGKQGEVVAEFKVSSHSLKNEDAPLKRFDHFPFPPRITLKDNQDFERCTDSKSRAILYPQDNFAFAAHNFERPLPLARPANSLIGRFSLRRAGIQPDLYKSVTVMGSCCWELFSGPDFTGQMLRLCKGKYTAGDLGNFANNFVSIRPVKHF